MRHLTLVRSARELTPDEILEYAKRFQALNLNEREDYAAALVDSGVWIKHVLAARDLAMELDARDCTRVNIEVDYGRES